MDRNFYYVGIAFFGMINGLFNQALVPFAYLFATVLAPGAAVRLEFAHPAVRLADGLHRTIIAAGIPAALYERFIGAKDDSTEFRCGSGSPGPRCSRLPRSAISFRSGSDTATARTQL